MKRRMLRLSISLMLTGISFAGATELSFGRMGADVISRFEDKSLYGSDPLDLDKWEVWTREDLALKCPAIVSELSKEAFSQEAYNSIKAGEWDQFLPDVSDFELELFSGYINGLLKSRDRYALWESPTAVKRSDSVLKGYYTGIGVAWDSNRREDGAVRVSWVAHGGPCHSSGIRKGDFIVGLFVDDEKINLPRVSIDGIGTAIRRGRSIRMQTDGGLQVVVAAENIVIEEVVNEIQETDEAISILWRSVNKSSVPIIRSGIRKAKETGKELILDLTENGGGMTNVAREVIGLFIPGKFTGVNWIYVDEFGRSRTYELTTYSKWEWEGDLIVKVGPQTASAAEIVMIGLSQREHTQIIGGNSYGKFESQDLIQMSNGSRLRVTVAKFQSVLD